jgi:hypothetical protein
MREEVPYPPSGGVYVLIKNDYSPIWKNQCGGYACNHKVTRGYLKLAGGREEEEKLTDFFCGEKWGGWCCEGIDEETAKFIESVIDSFEVNKEEMNNSQEAWIEGFLIVGGEKLPATLVWENSD